VFGATTSAPLSQSRSALVEAQFRVSSESGGRADQHSRAGRKPYSGPLGKRL